MSRDGTTSIAKTIRAVITRFSGHLSLQSNMSSVASSSAFNLQALNRKLYFLKFAQLASTQTSLRRIRQLVLLFLSYEMYHRVHIVYDS